MKRAADFRSLARESLRGKWFIAVLAGLVASILGAIGSSGPELKLNIDASGANINLTYADQVLFSSNGGLNPQVQSIIFGGAFIIALISIVFVVIYFVLGSIVGVGYAKFNLDLVDHREAGFESLFAYISNWKTTAVASLLQTVYILLWSLLFIIPGIIAFYSYAMTEYILAEHPELSASEAIRRSKEMMKGNRFRLFCLEFSFIGWGILCGFTFGIGNLWLTPYVQASRAAFYREVSGTEYYYSGEYSEDKVYEGEVF